MKSIAFYNNKGGVGKTTSVINLAYALSESMNLKVLVIDCDGQQNSSRFFAAEGKKHGIEDTLLNGSSPAKCFSHSRYKSVDVLVSSEKLNEILGGFEQLSKEQQQKNTKKLLDDWNNKYDYILLDLPPAMNRVNEVLMSASDCVIVPVELGTFAIQGIANVTETLNRINARFGGCFVSKFDKNNPSDYALLDILKGSLGNKMFKTVIPFSRVIKNSVSYRLTALEYMSWEEAAIDYLRLAKELTGKVGM